MTDMKPTIREIRAEELRATADFRRAMVLEIDGKDTDEFDPGWRQRYMAFFQGLLESGRGQIYVAEDNGALIGMAAIYKLANHRSEVYQKQSAHVCSVYVAPAWRRRGIARVLTVATIDWAKRQGCEVVRLRTSPMGKAVYEHIGFRPSNELELRF